MRYSVWSQNKAVASFLAEKRMAELRRWAMEQRDWSGPPVGQDDGYTQFHIQVELGEPELASPSVALEEGFSEPRDYRQSARRATVRVSWNNGNNEVSLVSLLREPQRGWRPRNPIVVTAAPAGTVGPGTIVTLTAIGYSSDGAVEDLCFTWSVEPEFPNPGLGTVTPSHNGRRASFRNLLNLPSGSGPSTGRCRVYATATYGGQERRGSSEILDLIP